jgi:glycosyltransferase involved in cell wall biosynthesis
MMISVIVPVFNREALVAHAIGSVIAQSHQEWELLLVDDGSTDGSVAVCEHYARQDRRISCYRRDRLPKGAPVCRNTGLAHARGDLVIFLDSDDLLAPWCLETRAAYMQEHPELAYAVFPMLAFNEQPGDSDKLWNVFSEDDDLELFLKPDLPWSTTSPVWRRQQLINLGGWEESAHSWQDWELHVRALAARLPYRKVNALPDCFVRRGETVRMSNEGWTQKKINSRVGLFELAHGNLRKHHQDSRYFGQLACFFYTYAEAAALYHNLPEARAILARAEKLGLIAGKNLAIAWRLIRLRKWAFSRSPLLSRLARRLAVQLLKGKLIQPGRRYHLMVGLEAEKLGTLRGKLAVNLPRV